MSNRNKRTPVGEGEPTFSQSCLSKWSKGMKQGAKWDKVCVRCSNVLLAAGST